MQPIGRVLIVAVLIGGCAARPQSANELADREYRKEDTRIVAIERYEQLKRSCADAGGVVQTRRTAGRGLPRINEMNMATCDRPDTRY